MKLSIILGLLLFSVNSHSECLYPIKKNTPMICNKDSYNNNSYMNTLDGGSTTMNNIYVNNREYQRLENFYNECLDNNLEACQFLETYIPKPNYEMFD